MRVGSPQTTPSPLAPHPLAVHSSGSNEESVAALRESQRMLATLLSNLPGLAYRCHHDAKWTMQFVSEGCRDLTGYTAEDLVGNRTISYEEIIHPVDRARVREEVEAAVREGRRFELTYRIKTRQGTERWVIEHGVAVRSAEGAVSFLEGIITDITENRRAEQALHESEEKLARAFRASPDAISISDATTGRIIDVNEGFERASGFSRDQIIGRTSQELGFWIDPDGRTRMMNELGRHGCVRNMEVAARMRDDVHRTFLLSAEPVEIGGRACLVVLGHDITEQKSAEQALRESEAKFSRAFRSSPYALTISEVATGRYIDVNESFERVSGRKREEVLGRTSTELGIWANPDDRAELLRKLEADGHVRGLEMNFLRLDGQKVIARCSCEVVEIDGRKCLLNTIEDITEQRKSEAARTALEAQLRQAQKLDELGQLAGGIAHDFNNILTGVIAYSELALLDADRPTEVRRHVGEVLKAGTRAKELVRQILAFSRQQTQERKPMRLHPIVLEAVKLLRSTLPKTLEIETRIDPIAPVVLADPTQIHQVVMNLCTNAAHALRNEPAGRITIVLESVQLDAAACAGTPELRPGRHAALTIRDTGHGMDAETLKRIFEPFFTTKASGEGTGLGLAVVYGIVEDHDGAVTVESRVGEGTTFRILLPQHTTLTVPAMAQAEAMPRGAGEHILVIDDESMIVDSTLGLLKHLGYKVTAHTDPRAALDAFQGKPDAFDLVVTDLMMPRITGIEVVRRVRLARPNLPILMVSGYSGTWSAENLKSLGVRALIAKPMTSSELAVAVHEALVATAGTRR
jgi:PAS domain S-box-containing protein